MLLMALGCRKVAVGVTGGRAAVGGWLSCRSRCRLSWSTSHIFTVWSLLHV